MSLMASTNKKFNIGELEFTIAKLVFDDSFYTCCLL